MKPINLCRRDVLGALGCAVAFALPAYSQEAPSTGTASANVQASDARQGPAKESSAADLLQLEEIIVTGRSADHTKFETSYAVTTISEQELAQQAPLSVADLISKTPGIYVESSGGEVGNNVYSRGLPNDNYRYLPLLEDGLPVWEEGAGAFTNADLFFRADATTSSVQIVRGGTASILASNAPGGSVNVITKKGTETFQGLVKFEVGDYGHYRTDLNLSGPINDKLLFQVGGFQRINNGLRDPGFTGNKGGQFRLGLTYKMDDGEIFVGYKKLDDHNIFYTAIPLANTSQGLPGLSATDGTLVSSAFGTMLVPDGQGLFNKIVNLSDGAHTDTGTLTVLFDQDLGGGFSMHNKLRRTSGTVDYTALFSNGVTDAQTFLNNSLTTLQAANPATVSAVYRIAGGDGANLTAANMPNSLVLTEGYWNTYVTLDNLINDFSLEKKLDTAFGTHDFVVGVYYSQFDQQQVWNWNDILVQATNQPSLLDVVGRNASGNDTISLTDHGLLNLHTNLQDFRDHVRNIDVYFTDSWQVNDKLRVDGGMRFHNVEKNGLIAGTKAVNLGDATTIADDSVSVFNGVYKPYTFSAHEKAWSVGANYQLSRKLAFFARAGDSFRVTPEFAQWFNCCTPVENHIRMYEGGLKFAADEFSAFVTLFYNNFPNLSFNTVTTVNGVQVTQSAQAAAEAKGVEVEFVWKPATMFDVAFSGNYQDILYTSFSGVDPTSGPFSFTGNQIVRQPKVSASVRPSLHFGPGGMIDVFGDWHYIGLRYADVANTVELPAYSEIDLGFAVQLSDSVRVQVNGTNILNDVGLTEGNPRAGVINGVQQTAFQGRPTFGRHFRASLECKF